MCSLDLSELLKNLDLPPEDSSAVAAAHGSSASPAGEKSDAFSFCIPSAFWIPNAASAQADAAPSNNNAIIKPSAPSPTSSTSGENQDPIAMNNTSTPSPPPPSAPASQSHEQPPTFSSTPPQPSLSVAAPSISPFGSFSSMSEVLRPAPPSASSIPTTPPQQPLRFAQPTIPSVATLPQTVPTNPTNSKILDYLRLISSPGGGSGASIPPKAMPAQQGSSATTTGSPLPSPSVEKRQALSALQHYYALQQLAQQQPQPQESPSRTGGLPGRLTSPPLALPPHLQPQNTQNRSQSMDQMVHTTYSQQALELQLLQLQLQKQNAATTPTGTNTAPNFRPLGSPATSAPGATQSFASQGAARARSLPGSLAAALASGGTSSSASTQSPQLTFQQQLQLLSQLSGASAGGVNSNNSNSPSATGGGSVAATGSHIAKLLAQAAQAASGNNNNNAGNNTSNSNTNFGASLEDSPSLQLLQLQLQLQQLSQNNHHSATSPPPPPTPPFMNLRNSGANSGNPGTPSYSSPASFHPNFVPPAALPPRLQFQHGHHQPAHQSQHQQISPLASPSSGGGVGPFGLPTPTGTGLPPPPISPAQFRALAAEMQFHHHQHMLFSPQSAGLPQHFPLPSPGGLHPPPPPPPPFPPQPLIVASPFSATPAGLGDGGAFTPTGVALAAGGGVDGEADDSPEDDTDAPGLVSNPMTPGNNDNDSDPDGDPNNPGGPKAYAQPCAHNSHWKRLRAKRGYSHYLCKLCGAKWRKAKGSQPLAVPSS